MRRSLLSYAFLSAFLIAVFLLQFSKATAFSSWVWIFVGTAFVIGLLFSKHAGGMVAAACALGLAFGSGAVAWHERAAPPGHIESLPPPLRVTTLAHIVEPPIFRRTMTIYTVTAERMTTASGAAVPLAGSFIIRDTKRKNVYHPGDRIIATGTLRAPWPIADFRYDEYLALQGISALMLAPEIRPAPLPRLRTPTILLMRLREHVESAIARVAPPPLDAFLQGLITGGRSGIPKEITDDFKAASLSHVLAISGFNVTIILTALSGLLFWIPLRLRLVPLLLGLTAFTVFTGAGASVVRAAVMGALGLLAVSFGRTQDMRLTTLWTLFAMLLWNPDSLGRDAGFQLSFLAVIGMMEGGPLVEPLTRRLPAWGGIRESAQATLSAQLLTTPWIALCFGRISVVGPVANILAAPLIPLAMATGFAALCAEFLWHPLGVLLGGICGGFLRAILLIAHTCASLPFASLPLRLNVPAIMLLFGGITGGIAWSGKRKNCEEMDDIMESGI